MSRFVSADWHLYHGNMIGYTNRPCKNTKEMHELLIKKHNAIVGPKDEFWLLGDLCVASPEYVGKIRKVVDRFNGVKHICLGNHDDWKAQSYVNAGFLTAHTAFWFELAGFNFVLAHDPAIYTAIENDPKAVLLCGHIHKLFKHLLPGKKVINVGVDANDFTPLSIEEDILKLLKENL